MSREHAGKKKRRRRWRLRHHAKPHTRPGTIVSPEKAAPTKLRVTAYGPNQMVDYPDCRPSDIEKVIGEYPVLWVDAVGLKDHEIIRQVGEILELHPLALEDMGNVPQRPKVEEYPKHLFAVAHTIVYDTELRASQVSFFAGKGFVVSWREKTCPPFEFLRKRLEVKGGTTRSSGVDYLLYALFDETIDLYFPALEKLSDKLDDLDDAVDRGENPDLIREVHDTRHDIRQLRRIVWPLRDAIDGLMKKHRAWVGEEAMIHFRDCHDHIVQILDSLDSYREACSDVRDHYSTEMSNRMNETMRLLTIISTIFIPLGFIAGLYGMNFNPEVSGANMPETQWRWGYPFALGLMAAVAIGQFFFFRGKGWIGRSAAHSRPRNETPAHSSDTEPH